jgi:hypothetical protein
MLWHYPILHELEILRYLATISLLVLTLYISLWFLGPLSFARKHILVAKILKLVEQPSSQEYILSP